jgi:hypothetical protein
VSEADSVPAWPELDEALVAPFREPAIWLPAPRSATPMRDHLTLRRGESQKRSAPAQHPWKDVT